MVALGRHKAGPYGIPRAKPLGSLKDVGMDKTYFVVGLSVALGLGLSSALARGQDSRAEDSRLSTKRPATAAIPPNKDHPEHRFWDRTNLELFTGVVAVRALDFTSTQHFRELGNREVLFSNAIVDNKPLFATLEVAGITASIGLSYLLHRKGHHRAERWVSIVHIGVAMVGDAHNYSLGRVKTVALGSQQTSQGRRP